MRSRTNAAVSGASSRAITRRDRSASTSDETDGVDERNAGIGIAIGAEIGVALGAGLGET